MVDAGRSVFAGGVAIGVVFGAVVGLGVAMRRFGLLSEVDVPARAPGSPALPVESESGHGSRAIGRATRAHPSRGESAATDPLHELIGMTEFDAGDWSAHCQCGAIQHGLGSKEGCMAWAVLHASVEDAMRGRLQ